MHHFKTNLTKSHLIYHKYKFVYLLSNTNYGFYTVSKGTKLETRDSALVALSPNINVIRTIEKAVYFGQTLDSRF